MTEREFNHVIETIDKGREGDGYEIVLRLKSGRSIFGAHYCTKNGILPIEDNSNSARKVYVAISEIESVEVV